MTEPATPDARADERGVDQGLPCAGLNVVELVLSSSDLGLGLAGSLPGMLFAELGADVLRVSGPRSPEIDDGVPWGQVWQRDKRQRSARDSSEIIHLLDEADVALVYGEESAVEERGLGAVDALRRNPALIYTRCRPSRTSMGSTDDYSILVEARAGLYSQISGHREGPIFIDIPSSGAGAAFLMVTSALALLLRRTLTGLGAWSDTSLYDGLLATIGTMIGRSERAAAEVERYWEKGSTFPNFLYRCADGELLQVWFGGKGMYRSLLEVLGDEPSTEGYYTDQVNGALNARAERWRDFFITHPRDFWIRQLRDAGVACEPVLAPGEVLSDPHLSAVGLAVSRTVGFHELTEVGRTISVTPVEAPERNPRQTASGVLLEGVNVLDFSAFLAGPFAAQILADLGANVIKVEPPGGEAMRAATYFVAACQRGKRSLALDLNAPEVGPTVERLIKWADVVLHNFRVGVSDRLGIDQESVARLNPHVVYCHASAFGSSGTRATFPGNDALMQALTGLESSVGGSNNLPIAPSWIPIDVAGGWLAATSILAGLHACAASGKGQVTSTSLLGAGMLLQSGVFQRDGQVVRRLEIDHDETGYGPGYRIYESLDGTWFALVTPDPAAWDSVRSLVAPFSLSPEFTPLRGDPLDAAACSAEQLLESAFATKPAEDWIRALRAHGVPVELVSSLDRDAFRRRILDDPLNRQLGRVASFDTRDWGQFEQIGPLFRCGPFAYSGPLKTIPGVGEHTREVLAELGCDPREIDELIQSKTAYQAPT